VLQLERHRTGKRAKPEENKLLEAHREAWLGPLAPVVRKDGLRFERGFIVACRVFTPSDALADRVSSAREWSTVEQLALDNDLGVLGRNHHNVRMLTGVTESRDVVGDPATFAKLAHVGVRINLSTRDAFERSPGLPSLRSLHVAGSYPHPLAGAVPPSLRWLWSTKIGKALHKFSIGSGVPSLASWLAEDATHRLPVDELTITSIRWSNAGLGWTLTFHRDERGVLSKLVGLRGPDRLYERQPPLDELCDALARIPAGTLRKIDIRPSRSLGATVEARRRLEELVARLGVQECLLATDAHAKGS
jgi:hypothetical protein